MTEKELSRIEKMLEAASHDRRSILQAVHTIEVNVAKNTVSLDDHMRRTDANEARLKMLEDRVYKLIILNSSIVAGIFAIGELAGRLF